jgi:hypothetical protein
MFIKILSKILLILEIMYAIFVNILLAGIAVSSTILRLILEKSRSNVVIKRALALLVRIVI